MGKQVACTECDTVVDSVDTRNGLCNKCYMHAYYAAHRQEFIDNAREWKRNHPDRAHEVRRAYDKKRRAVMPKEQKVAESRRRTARMSDAEKERRKAYLRRYYAKNKKRRLQQTRDYRRQRPEVNAASDERRRARKLGSNPDLTSAQWKQVIEAYGHRCAYCGKKFQRLTMDHIIPLSKGGRHTMTNVVPACRSCNCRKNDGVPLVPIQPVML